jgi:tetratricopeptide (TPR) repeat protein
MGRAFALAVVIAFTQGAAAGPAAKIDPNQAKADKLFEEGQSDYKAGQFEQAIALFKQAYELVHDPVYEFNIAQAYRKVFDCENAYDYYQRYLKDAPDATNAEIVKRWLTELQPCVDRARKDHEAARRAEEDRKGAAVQTHPVAPPPPPETPEPSDGGKLFRIAGIATAGVGVVGLAVGIGYGVHSASLRDELAQKCAARCNWDDPATRSLDSSGEHANTLAKVGYIGGGIAVVIGAALYTYGMLRVEHVTVAPAPGGGTVGATFSF